MSVSRSTSGIPRLMGVCVLLVMPLRLGAATIRGVILTNELGGAPIANVQVSAVEGANPVSSRSNGTFVVEFPDKHPGETVQLIVQKPGMAVVNEFQLQLTLPKPANATPLTLLLCRAAEREEMASRFYRLKSYDAIERSYRRKLEELEAKNEATEKAREQLRIERDQAREVAKGAAEQLARVKFGETSELYRQAMSLFEEGKVDEALAILDDEKLQRTAAAAREQKEAVENELQQVVEAYTLKGQLLASKFQFDEAQKAYKAAIAIAPEDADANFNSGVFYQDLNRFSEAESSYARALDIFRQKADEAGVAKTLNNLGILYGMQNRTGEARKAFDDALEIRRKLAQQDPATQLPDVAMILNNLGTLLSYQNQMAAARTAYEEALEIRRKLVQQNPATHLPAVAIILNNLGNVLVDQNRVDEARKAYGEALQTYVKLVQENPDTYLPDVATILNDLGGLHAAENRIEEAQKTVLEALKIYRKLAQQNPATYLKDVAMALNNLGMLCRDQNRMEEARKAIDEALEINRKLAQQNPDAFLPDVARTLENLGMLLSDQKRVEEAHKGWSEALSIYEAFAKTNPEKYGQTIESIKKLLHDLAR